MYGNVHGTIGAAIVVSTAIITKDVTITYLVGGMVAFLLHDTIDLLGEKSYGNTKTTIVYEAVPFSIFSIMAFLSGVWEMYFYGWFMGNLMDIIDKKLYLSIIFPSKYKSMHLFRCHRRAPKINFTRKQTINATILCSIVTIIMTALIRLL